LEKITKNTRERLSVINGWTTKREKLQHLLSCIEGSAAEVVNEINDSEDTTYDQLWTALSLRYTGRNGKYA